MVISITKIACVFILYYHQYVTAIGRLEIEWKREVEKMQDASELSPVLIIESN